MLTQELVKELFDYVPETGDLIWKLDRGSRAKKGDIAGGAHPSGYTHTSINGKRYLNHRIIFLYHYGHLPKYIDHINQNKSDNRIENLREATFVQNLRNVSKRNTNMTGYKGVSLGYSSKTLKKYFSRIMLDGNPINLGYFSDPIDAAVAYNLAAEQYFGEFAHFNGLPDDQAWGIF